MLAVIANIANLMHRFPPRIATWHYRIPSSYLHFLARNTSTEKNAPSPAIWFYTGIIFLERQEGGVDSFYFPVFKIMSWIPIILQQWPMDFFPYLTPVKASIPLFHLNGSSQDHQWPSWCKIQWCSCNVGKVSTAFDMPLLKHFFLFLSRTIHCLGFLSTSWPLLRLLCWILLFSPTSFF